MNDATPRLHLTANQIDGALAVAEHLLALREEVAAHSGTAYDLTLELLIQDVLEAGTAAQDRRDDEARARAADALVLRGRAA